MVEVHQLKDRDHHNRLKKTNKKIPDPTRYLQEVSLNYKDKEMKSKGTEKDTKLRQYSAEKIYIYLHTDTVTIFLIQGYHWSDGGREWCARYRVTRGQNRVCW